MFTPQFVDTLAEAIARRVISQVAAQSSATKRLFTLPDAAAYLGRTTKAVQHLVDRGVIPVTKLDGKRQIDKTTLDKLIADHTYFEN